MSSVVVTVLFLFGVFTVIQCRQMPFVGYFPSRVHPWSWDDDEKNFIYGDSKSEGLYGGSVDNDGKKYQYVAPKVLESLEKYNSGVESNDNLKANYYNYVQDGFVPADLRPLDNVYWWKKRFAATENSSEDLPFFVDLDSNSEIIPGSKKREGRDYTAAQLVNMLKALSKARRQRQVRIIGKGQRFGISK